MEEILGFPILVLDSRFRNLVNQGLSARFCLQGEKLTLWNVLLFTLSWQHQELRFSFFIPHF